LSVVSISSADAAGPAPSIDRRCFDRGCEQEATFPCQYIDRVPRSCASWCCEHHGRAVGDEKFCVRHAGVMDALLVDPLNLLRKPGVDNRAPSLVAWVAKSVESPLHEILQSLAKDGETVVTEPLRPIIADDGKTQAWRRSWRLSDGHDARLVVGLEVDEAYDSAVLVTVYTDVVLRDVPPWITARLRGEAIAPDEDRARRLAFFQELLDAVGAGATRRLGIDQVAVPRLTALA